MATEPDRERRKRFALGCQQTAELLRRAAPPGVAFVLGVCELDGTSWEVMETTTLDRRGLAVVLRTLAARLETS